MNDRFEEQITWVRGLSGEQQEFAGCVMSWNAVKTTVHQLIAKFNDISSTDDERNRRFHKTQLN